MEDVKEHFAKFVEPQIIEDVSILVLMEDVKEHCTNSPGCIASK